ncbi:MAG: long-chain-fatty-acid--CoA ligase [Brevibacillus sp.]|nr:long-chain-fatty-acid--CoA ligase [Brevibacillus sp.]
MLLTKGLLYAARSNPNKTAVIDGAQSYTYAELAARTAKVKGMLNVLGIKKGDRVALCMLNSFRYLELLFGITAHGAIVVPLNTRLSAGEISFILEDAGAEALFIHEEFLPMIPAIKRTVKGLRQVILAEDAETAEAVGDDAVLSYEELLRQQPEEVLSAEGIHEDDIAGLYYTGGTTGRSKGVMLTHKNLVSNAYHVALGFAYSEDDVYMHAAPMFHLADGASTFAITLVGGTHTFVRSFTPVKALEVIQQARATCCLLVPTMVNMLIHTPEFHQYDLSSLRKLMYGASPMSSGLLKTCMQLLPDVQFFQGYGMTEASPVLSILNGKHHLLGVKGRERLLVSCGQAVQGVEMKVVDADGKELPVGQVGEFAARGPNIMKGYWNMPEETAKAMRGGWYHTGDMGYKDEDNFFYVVDRAKDMIITGGENVYSTEVEDVLQQHPAVLECAVIGVPDERWGEAVKAVVVLKEQTAVDEEEILAFVRGKLANYKVPKSIDFAKELPKSGAGKILKRSLRDQYWQGRTRNVQ